MARRIRVEVRGVVQGVGFRPCILRLASSLDLAGRVFNTPAGVGIDVEGSEAALDEFLIRIESEAPVNARIESVVFTELQPAGTTGFTIASSAVEGAITTHPLPDLVTCAECMRDVRDPSDRRYRYPFTSCTCCGPRYSILGSLPYDRRNTSMAGFPLCVPCKAEYDSPMSRRFHAQPLACADCGPRLTFRVGPDDKARVVGERALARAVRTLRDGGILAVKGLGGFQLLVDARSSDAVARLRSRKVRPDKPFAVMFASLEQLEPCCSISDVERRLLSGPVGPIVLLNRSPGVNPLVHALVAPDSNLLGALLPTTPLHHILLGDLGFPIVCTSGNISQAPIVTQDRAALATLAPIADGFLGNDRPILRPLDDSVMRVVLGRPLVLRRARGLAPLPLPLPTGTRCVLGLGAQMKSTFTLAARDVAYVSQHLGDLNDASTVESFETAVPNLQTLLDVRPTLIAHDAHPDHAATHRAARLSGIHLAVQHHHAHIASCMADNGLDDSVLGVAWDGTGAGPDGTIWGGEFLEATRADFVRRAHWRTFRLPGNEAAVREPRRSALGLLTALDLASVGGPTVARLRAAFSPQDLAVLERMLARGLSSPLTSSAGRLFDAVASLVGLCDISTFEGQAAMRLEQEAARADGVEDSYPVGWRSPSNEDEPAAGGRLGRREPPSFKIAEGSGGPDSTPRNGERTPAGPDERSALELDPAPMLLALIRDCDADVPRSTIAARFHNALADSIVMVAARLSAPVVVLTGGCFQNAVLLTAAVERLRRSGHGVHWHRDFPPNDGGISLGQAAVALSRPVQPRD